jgi:hypothetical protein
MIRQWSYMKLWHKVNYLINLRLNKISLDYIITNLIIRCHNILKKINLLIELTNFNNKFSKFFLNKTKSWTYKKDYI